MKEENIAKDEYIYRLLDRVANLYEKLSAVDKKKVAIYRIEAQLNTIVQIKKQYGDELPTSLHEKLTELETSIVDQLSMEMCALDIERMQDVVSPQVMEI